ncbi:hypothetical protein [Streptomyces sp. NPDC007355]|uniref:hypothetical protein n=1 Tax=Streptomyces sp. NPDC007355 TaxID=3364778 RepID=UPI00368717CD
MGRGRTDFSVGIAPGRARGAAPPPPHLLSDVGHRYLLQLALVHVNMLLLQEILSEEKWQQRPTGADRRALFPLFRTHVNP